MFFSTGVLGLIGGLTIKPHEDLARTLQKHVARRQDQTFTDWFAELRELAGESWPEVAEQAPTAFAIWTGGGTPPQALHMIDANSPGEGVN